MTNLTITTETDSDWIGDIPDNWSLKKLKYIFSEKKSTSNSDLQCGSISFGKVIFKNDDKVPDSTKQSYQEVLEGEFLINPLNLNFDLKSLRIGLSKIRVVVSQGYIVLKINDGYLPSYYQYLLRKFDVEHMKSLGQGVRQTISFTHIKDEKLVVPPPGEQELISRYLDKKTEQIDFLIEKIQKKIELLKEQRTSLINQCVTKGLDPNVEMKDSGVEWIGEIPKHWELKKLKHISTVDLSSVDRHEHDDELQVNICHYPDVYRNEFISETTTLPNGTCSESEFRKFSLQVGDILLTKDSESPDDIGIPTFVLNPPENAVCGYHIAILRLRTPEHHSGYLYRFIESKNVKDYFYTVASGITRFGLGKGSLENLIIPCPPLDEQTEISGKISNLSSTNSSISQKLKDKIHLLTEYRQSLISSVVTGKVRVTEDMI